jgi:FAD/FMN-containing dehydrogenase
MKTLPIVWRSLEPAYEEARVGRIFNLRRPDRFPLAIVNVSEESHVIEVVKLALEKKCRISVRSGGHSWAAWSLRDNAILVDFGNYHEMILDQETGIVRVSPSTTSGDLNIYLLGEGRMFAGGHCPNVGLGGFLLQGGAGWNSRVQISETPFLTIADLLGLGLGM